MVQRAQTLFMLVRQAWEVQDAQHKCHLVHEAWNLSQQADADWGEMPADLAADPGRPEAPKLVPPEQVPFRNATSVQGRAALLHAIAHIEFNAINLALDAVLRFPELPLEFRLGWLQVAEEEARHFELVTGHMKASCNADYGDFSAHGGLWEMARRTAHDPLVRMALVPRLFEARGLDATPGIMRKFQGVGDRKAVDILQVILDEEVGHVALGDQWFRYLCQSRGLVPEVAYQALLQEFDAPRPRRPFNEKARLAAGFTKAELAAL